MDTDIFGLQRSTNIDPFLLGKTSALRKGLNSFVNRHPNWMVYIRKDSKYPSPDSYDPRSNSPNTYDQATFGLGYKAQYEKHAVRRVVRAADAQSPIEEYGYLAKFKVVIYTPRYYYPMSKDLYLEVEWDVEWQDIEVYGKPISIVNAFQVDEAISFREDEVTYMGCGCDTYNFTISDQDRWLKELGEVWTPKRII